MAKQTQQTEAAARLMVEDAIRTTIRRVANMASAGFTHPENWSLSVHEPIEINQSYDEIKQAGTVAFPDRADEIAEFVDALSRFNEAATDYIANRWELQAELPPEQRHIFDPRKEPYGETAVALQNSVYGLRDIADKHAFA